MPDLSRDGIISQLTRTQTRLDEVLGYHYPMQVMRPPYGSLAVTPGRLSDNDVTHVILGSMRRDPLVNDGTIINTLHRYVAYVAQKYPDAFQLVRTFGTADTEPAYLLRVRYDAAGMTYPNNDPDNAKKD